MPAQAGIQFSRCRRDLDVHFASPTPADRHARARGHPVPMAFVPWIPAFAGMTFGGFLFTLRHYPRLRGSVFSAVLWHNSVYITTVQQGHSGSGAEPESLGRNFAFDSTAVLDYDTVLVLYGLTSYS